MSFITFWWTKCSFLDVVLWANHVCHDPNVPMNKILRAATRGCPYRCWVYTYHLIYICISSVGVTQPPLQMRNVCFIWYINIICCDKGGAAAWVRSDFLQKKQSKRYIACSDVELVIGLEPTTCWLQISCSANWAIPAYPASKLTNIRIPHFCVFVKGFFKFF